MTSWQNISIVLTAKLIMKTVVLFICGLLTIVQAFLLFLFTTKPRVIDGEEAKLGERPYQVALRKSGTLFCVGIIINKYWILTAAHCVVGQSPSFVEVVAGTIDLNEPYSSHKAKRIIIHKDYDDRDSYRNDFALIKLAKPVEYSSRIKPAVLPAPHSKVRVNSTVVVSGWGHISDGTLPNKPQKAAIYVLDTGICRSAVKVQGYNVYPTHVCANDPMRQRGECNGDSGGPLTFNGTLTGMVSWSIKALGCASPTYPSVFTRVSEYIDWIHQHTR